MKKSMKIIISVVLVLVVLSLIVVGGFFYFLQSPLAAAILYTEGAAQVNTGSGWQTAFNEMHLSQGNSIKTGESEATVVLLGGEIMHLEPHTELSLTHLDKKMDLQLVAGEVWNKITKLSGVAEYSIQTPTTVATVRGTDFLFTPAEVDVFEGQVQYAHETENILVHTNKRARAAAMKEEDIPEAIQARHTKIVEKYVDALKHERENEIKHKLPVLAIAGISEEKVHDALNNIDIGEMDEDAVYEKIPAPLKPQAERIYKLTKQIKALTPH